MPRTPGPGTYDPPGNIKDANEHMPSHYKNQSGWHFNADSRRTQQLPHLKSNQILITKNEAPGPGSYSLPSEFGDWEYPPLPVPINSTEQIMSNSNGF